MNIMNFLKKSLFLFAITSLVSFNCVIAMEDGYLEDKPGKLIPVVIDYSMSLNVRDIDYIKPNLVIPGTEKTIAQLETFLRSLNQFDTYFFASRRDLVKYLQDDWRLVKTLNKNHIELANHLKNIIELVKQKESEILERSDQSRKAFQRALEVKFNEYKEKDHAPDKVFDDFLNFIYGFTVRAQTKLLTRGFTEEFITQTESLLERWLFMEKWICEKETDIRVKYLDQNLIVSKINYHGYQCDLIYNDNSKWDCDYLIWNTKFSDIKARVTGTDSLGTIRYIENFGFYGGNRKYRVDPRVITAIITGDRRYLDIR